MTALMKNLFLAFVPLALAVSAEAPTTAPTDLKAAKPGDLIWLETQTNLNAILAIPLTKEPGGGVQFLFSDKPEYFRTGNGIAMQEDVQPGVVRLYVYHVPTPDDRQHVISAVIENLGNVPMNFRFLKYAPQKPGGDYHKIGKSGLLDYFNAQPQSQTHTLAPGRRMVIDPKMEETPITKDILIHGLYEFEIDQPARITTFQRDPGQDSLTVIDSLAKLPQVLPGFHPSGAGRGLFLTSDFAVSSEQVIDTRDGIRQFIVADGKTDPWIVGRDSISGDNQQLNKGNYGVMYHAKLTYRSSDGKGLALLICNGRAEAKFCRYAAAAVKVNDGIHPGGAVPLPRDQVRFEGLPQAVVIQTYPPLPPDQVGTIEFTYSPPGASCLPTPILLVPFEP